MAKINNLYDKDSNEIIYPVTHERAVVDSNGTTLESKLEALNVSDGGHSPSPEDFQNYGKKYLKPNIKNETVKTITGKEAITLTAGKAFYIDPDNHTLDYTNSNSWVSGTEAQRSIGAEIDVQAGDIIEFRASAMTSAYSGTLYVKYRLWVLVDPVTKEILKDDDDNYIMADAAADYEDEPIAVTMPKSGHLCISCWTGRTSRDHHDVNNILFTSVQKDVNVFDNTLCTSENTVYVIQHDFDLNGRDVTLPFNSVLVFDGGSIKSSGQQGVLRGNMSVISSPITNIFGHNVSIRGTWKNDIYYVEWFGAKGDGVTDDTKSIQAALDVSYLSTLPIQKTILLTGTYLITDTLNIYSNTTVKGTGAFANSKTITANFDSNLKCAMQSANFRYLNYHDGMAKPQLDGNADNYIPNIRIEDISLQGKYVVANDGTIVKRPIFCGIKIAGSSNSSIKNCSITGFFYGVARFATWYASDEDLWISAFKCGYVAFDMNGFSIRNGYINANPNHRIPTVAIIKITPTEDEVFLRADHDHQSTMAVSVQYSNGGLYNIVSETSDYARYIVNYSEVADIHPYFESNKTCYYVGYSSSLDMSSITYVGNTNFMVLESSSIAYVRCNYVIPGRVKVSDTCNIVYSGRESNLYTNNFSNGMNFYRPTTKQQSWWLEDNLIYGDANGFGLQDTWKGTYANRPVAGYMQPGAIYMKQEGDGSIRPIFQSQEAKCAYAVFNILALGDTNGTITFTVGDASASFEYNLTKANYATIAALCDAIVLSLGWSHVKVKKINDTSFKLYAESAGVISSSAISYDLGTSNVDISIGETYLGQDAIFVDALGGNAENDKKVSTLPATATDGDILFYTVIGKPVYYNNGHWYDFGDNEVTNPVEENEENEE